MCICSCGWEKGELIDSETRRKDGAGCLGAKAGNPGAKHCRRKQDGCQEVR